MQACHHVRHPWLPSPGDDWRKYTRWQGQSWNWLSTMMHWSKLSMKCDIWYTRLICGALESSPMSFWSVSFHASLVTISQSTFYLDSPFLYSAFCIWCNLLRWESHRLRRRTTMRHTGGSPKLTSSQFSPNLICLIPKLGSHCSKTDSSIWVKFLRAYKAWKWCNIFRTFGRPFRQFRGLESREMKYFLKIY